MVQTQTVDVQKLRTKDVSPELCGSGSYDAPENTRKLYVYIIHKSEFSPNDVPSYKLVISLVHLKKRPSTYED